MTNTTELTAEMIDELGVSLSGLEGSPFDDIDGYDQNVVGLAWYADQGPTILTDEGDNWGSMIFPTHALVVKVLEQLEKRIGPADVWGEILTAEVHKHDSKVWLCTPPDEFGETFTLSRPHLPPWFCSLFTKARKDAGWVVE
jgi:hypothetical protein